MARALRRHGWTVDWVGTTSSAWRTSTHFDGERTVVSGLGDPRLVDLFQRHPLDALFLHGDDHVRWMLEHWGSVPGIHRHLSKPEALLTALSKDRSLQLAESLGVPALPTERCSSPSEVAVVSRHLAPGGEVVLKGEGGAAGCAVAAVGSGQLPDGETWRRVTRFYPVVLVQRRVRGPRVDVTVVYEHGVERAACIHEKVATFPFEFGPTALGVTRRIDAVHDYTQRLFAALEWHGFANIEFRQDQDDGRWYFIEINPRVTAAVGIQDAAGMDVAAAWAAVCTGRGAEVSPGRTYREGVRFAWGVRGMALAMRRPWSVPAWGIRCLLGGGSDLDALDPALRRRAVRLACWTARHA
jgi:biotin carboxylase